MVEELVALVGLLSLAWFLGSKVFTDQGGDTT